jgi:hypothetical protein
MNDLQKTLALAGLAFVALIGAWFTNRDSDAGLADAKTQEVLFKEFTDPQEAASLEIVAFDEEAAEPTHFKVEKRDGVWTLPSHYSYPADAEDQMADAASSVMDIKAEPLVGAGQSDHELYGVLDPQGANFGAEGIGKRVIIQDASGGKLFDLILGKAVPEAEGFYYVRKPSSDTVYKSEIDTTKLSTKFENWIEKDLLQLNTFDISRVVFNNYTINEEQGGIEAEGEPLVVNYNDKDFKWSIDGLEADQEIDEQVLNDMKSAFDDMKIVDVRRKPEWLTPVLTKNEGARVTQRDLTDLAMHGFHLDLKNGELFCNEGEVRVDTNTGIQYVLRFGEVAVDSSSGEDGKKPDASDPTTGLDPAADPDDGLDVNRYIMVTAQYFDELLPKPTPPEAQAPESETPMDPDSTEPSDTDPSSTDPATTDPAATDPATTDPAATEETATDPTTTEEPSSDEPASDTPENASPSEEAAPQTDQLQGGGGDDAAPGPDGGTALAQATGSQDTETGTAASAAAEPATAETETAATGSDATETAEPGTTSTTAGPATGPPASTGTLTPSETETADPAQQEYQRQLDEWEQKKKDAQKKVEELNDRFGPWYYVISDDVYKKIRLKFSDIVKIKEGQESGLDALDQLKDEGLQTPPPAGLGNPFPGTAPQGRQ